MARCNCMAGLCEACSHVGALLFAIGAVVRMRESVTCTQEKSRWIMPSYVKEIPYIPVCEMDLSSAKKRHSTLGEQGSATPDPRERRNVQATTAEEQANFFERISNCWIKPAILSIIGPYNAAFVPVENKTLPKPLTELFNEEDLGDTLQELQQKSETAFNELKISVKEAERGRVTASKFKAACSTNADKPSKSLIKLICYPGAHRFSNAATKWGISNESKAREAYQFSIADQRLNLSVADSGLHISENWPFLGASPDGLVFCEYCGKGLCEIKCPYKYKDGMLVNYCCRRQQFLSEI